MPHFVCQELNMRQFDFNIEQEICKKYRQEGMTITFLARNYHCRNEAIKNVLVKYNIPIKRKGLSKNRLLKEDYFENIDSEEKAYFLGLFFTDGSIIPDPSGKRFPSIAISLKMSDINILEKLREEINMHSNLLYDKRKNKECAVLRFRSKKMADDLSKYGIVPLKTYKTKHLPNNIPPEFKIPFIRGLLDGDGSIYQQKNKNYRIDFCSYHKSICEDFKNLCNQLLDEPVTTTIENYGTAYHFRINKKKLVEQLATVLYKDCKISIARKYEMASKLFEDNNEEDIVYSDH